MGYFFVAHAWGPSFASVGLDPRCLRFFWFTLLRENWIMVCLWVMGCQLDWIVGFLSSCTSWCGELDKRVFWLRIDFPSEALLLDSIFCATCSINIETVSHCFAGCPALISYVVVFLFGGVWIVMLWSRLIYFLLWVIQSLSQPDRERFLMRL